MPADAAWDAPDLFKASIVPPSEINPDANAELDHILSRALEKRPRDRYPSAKELLEALDRWHPGRTDSAETAKLRSEESTNFRSSRHSSADVVAAEALAQRAFEARKNGRLAEAADLMEEAFNKSAELRTKFAHQVKLWRCGISM